MALHFLYYNFVRIHQAWKVAAPRDSEHGVADHLWEIGDIVDVLEGWEAAK